MRPLSLAAFALLALTLAAAPPAAAGDVVDEEVAGHHVTLCAIGVKGSCDPYDGHLVRATVDGQAYVVPDPCYTTMCW